MTLEQYAYIAEIVGVIVIVTTLVYLAIQTKQNTAAVQSSVRQAMLQEDRESLRLVIEFPSLDKRTNLTTEEATRLKAMLIHFIRTRENHWLQYQNGVLDQTTWVSYRGALIPVVFSSKFGRAFWQTDLISASMAPGFLKSINEWVNELDLPDADLMFPQVNITD